jgi:hypothetical protein
MMSVADLQNFGAKFKESFMSPRRCSEAMRRLRALRRSLSKAAEGFMTKPLDGA